MIRSMFTPKPPSGGASDWTPRQALLKALSECDDFDMIVITMGDRETNTFRAYNAGTKNVFERDGLIAALLGGEWKK